MAVEHILLSERHATAFPFNSDTRRAEGCAAIEALASVSGVGSGGLASLHRNQRHAQLQRLYRLLLQPAALSAPGLRPGFNPQDYVNRGNAFNCPDFQSQAEAQAVLRADPRDPNQMDTDRDGVACETRPPREIRSGVLLTQSPDSAPRTRKHCGELGAEPISVIWSADEEGEHGQHR